MSTPKKEITELIRAVIANDAEQVNELLNQGANPNATLDSALITPLHYAAQHDSLEVIPLLIEAGANIHAQMEPDALTPIDIAFMHQHEKIAQLLLIYSDKSTNHLH